MTPDTVSEISWRKHLRFLRAYDDGKTSHDTKRKDNEWSLISSSSLEEVPRDNNMMYSPSSQVLERLTHSSKKCSHHWFNSLKTCGNSVSSFLHHVKSVRSSGGVFLREENKPWIKTFKTPPELLVIQAPLLPSGVHERLAENTAGKKETVLINNMKR